jgi:hypothetical protein
MLNIAQPGMFPPAVWLFMPQTPQYQQVEDDPPPTQITIQGTDGVFANMSATPVRGKIYEELEPPTYEAVVGDNVPNYFETCITGIDEWGDVMIEGYPVGTFVVYCISLFVSFSFDFLGFLVTSFLAVTHAAKYGSQAGLGMTLVRYGFLYKDRAERGDFPKPDPRFVDDDYRPPAPDEEKGRMLWVAGIMAVFGVLAFVV